MGLDLVEMPIFVEYMTYLMMLLGAIIVLNVFTLIVLWRRRTAGRSVAGDGPKAEGVSVGPPSASPAVAPSAPSFAAELERKILDGLNVELHPKAVLRNASIQLPTLGWTLDLASDPEDHFEVELRKAEEAKTQVTSEKTTDALAESEQP